MEASIHARLADDDDERRRRRTATTTATATATRALDAATSPSQRAIARMGLAAARRACYDIARRARHVAAASYSPVLRAPAGMHPRRFRQVVSRIAPRRLPLERGLVWLARHAGRPLGVLLLTLWRLRHGARCQRPWRRWAVPPPVAGSSADRE
jgi:hypothetical protein